MGTLGAAVCQEVPRRDPNGKGPAKSFGSQVSIQTSVMPPREEDVIEQVWLGVEVGVNTHCLVNNNNKTNNSCEFRKMNC